MDPKPKFVDLLKLHGSIDWYDRHYLDAAMRWHAEQGDDVANRDPIFGPAPTVPSEPLSRGRTEVEFGRHILPRVFRVLESQRCTSPLTKRSCSAIVPFHSPRQPTTSCLDTIRFWICGRIFTGPTTHLLVRGHDRLLDASTYDSYAYETLGRIFVEYQKGGDTAFWKHRRVPIQLITLADSREQVLECFPFLDPSKTRVWSKGILVGFA